MILQCCKCGRVIGEQDSPTTTTAMLPIDPKGTQGRRWACYKCAHPDEIARGRTRTPELQHRIDTGLPLYPGDTTGVRYED